MGIEEDYARIKKKVDRAKQEEAELKGEQKALLKQLKDEFGCTTLKAAQKEVKKLEAVAQERKEEYEQALKAFNAKWEDQLE